MSGHGRLPRKGTPVHKYEALLTQQPVWEVWRREKCFDPTATRTSDCPARKHSRYVDCAILAVRSGDRIPVGWGEIFRSHPGQPPGQSVPIFPGSKAAGTWCWPPPLLAPSLRMGWTKGPPRLCCCHCQWLGLLCSTVRVAG